MGTQIPLRLFLLSSCICLLPFGLGLPCPTVAQFRCDDNITVSQSFRCDGTADCINGEDEENCESTVPITDQPPDDDSSIQPEQSSLTDKCPEEDVSLLGVPLTFPKGNEGNTINSSETCEDKNNKIDLPKAERFCGRKGWDTPKLIKCFSREGANEEVTRLANTSITKENEVQIAADIAQVALQVDELQEDDINKLIDAYEAITNENSSSPDVTSSVVATASEFMNLQQPYGRIIASLELQISHVQKSGTNYSEIKDNVLVEALIFNPSITKGLTLVKLHSNDTDTYNGVNEKRPKHTKTSIYLPQEVFEEAKKDKTNNGTIPISFVIYSNASLFGTNTSMNLFEENLNTKKYSHIISSEVISATVDGGPIENLDPPVILRFFLPENDKACEKRRCAYYVPNGTNSGTWSTDGCSTSMEGNSIVCKCDHLSSFTVLVGVELHEDLDRVMKLVTWIGSSLSILGLTICTSSLVLIKALRVKQSAQIHLNLCISLIAFYVTFLAHDWAVEEPKHCKYIASAIQYFCLVAVSWMTVEAVNMYFLFVKYERSNIPHFLPVSLALAYGLPLAPVLTVFVLIEPCDCYTYKCFLPNEYFLYLGFLLWLFLLVTANVVIFIMVIRNVVFRPILSTNAQLHKRREILLRIQQFALFWILLGLSWTFGFLSILPNFQLHLFEILFCLVTSLQGFVLFIFICLKNPEVREIFSKCIMTSCSQLGVTSNETNSSSLPLNRIDGKTKV